MRLLERGFRRFLAAPRVWVLAWLLASPGLTAIGWAAAEPEPRARVAVKGTGWWSDRSLRLSLERLLGEERGATLDANSIEDAALILFSSLGEQGYQRPQVEVEVTRTDGSSQRLPLDPALETALPRPLAVTSAAFHVQRGVRFTIHEVRFAGLQTLSEEEASAFFRPVRTLIPGGAARAYSPSRLNRALDGLQAELRLRGYAEAHVEAQSVQIDESSGRVDVDVEVRPGPEWWVESLQWSVRGEADLAIPTEPEPVGRAWSSVWQQDASTDLRQRFLRRGYPDVSVRLVPTVRASSPSRQTLAVTAEIVPGPRVTLQEVRFEGNRRTRESVLRRRVYLDDGEPLNPLALERARYRLTRLGIFDAIDLRYEPAEGTERAAIFGLRESRRWEANLLLGYGSYEQLRGGVEFRQYNLWGRAHQSRLELMQSMKSSRGEYTYTVPELFGEQVDGTARLFGLQREELAFLRQEYGGNITFSRPLPWIRADGKVGYTFQALHSKDNELATREVDNERIRVASLDLGLTRDRRDNPLRPRRGVRWFVQAELASRNLGGEVDYQRLEAGIAYHRSWGSGRWIHAGLTHGAIMTLGSDDLRLPVNKRFFPGGDNSVRGYQSGEAAPRDADGRFVGAKSYLLANVELEQALTANWSVVVFFDAVGTAVQLARYPFNERLSSAGFGLRYQTLIGPLRLEYGHNLRSRAEDPSGTLHFSIGFPF